MSSKLFHTVVAFGITLGAASVGCSAEPVDVPASSEAAVVSKDNANETKVDTDEATPAPEKDRFCEVAWPTTKGGPRPSDAQACIDPKNECGTYPGGFFSRERCVRTDAAGVCSGSGSLWMFCKETADGDEWACPAGTKKISECTWPEPAEPDTNQEQAAGE